jgi:short subunit fatty acids transporter
MMTESGLAKELAHVFVAISTRHTFPILVGIYSAFLGLFVPSAGGKVAHRSSVHIGCREIHADAPGLGRPDIQRH